MNIRKTLLAASVAGLAFVPTYAAAVVGTYLGEKGFSEQTQNAADTLETELAAAATKGESVRGASGALGQIVLNSGNLICNAWIIQFKIWIQKMHQDAIFNPDLDPLVQKANDLVAKLEAECTRTGLIGQTPTPGGGGTGSGGGTTAGGGGIGGGVAGGGGIGGGTGGKGGAPGGTGGGATDGPGAFTPTPGSSIADEICRRNCADKLEAMQKAVSEFEREDQLAKIADDDARRAEKAVTDAESKQASLTSELANLEHNQPAAGASLQVQAAWNTARNNLKSSLKNLANALPGLKKAAAEKRHTADTLWARAKELKAAADTATAAYNDCVRIWRSKASAACPPSNALQFPSGGAPATGTPPPVKSSGIGNNQPNSAPVLPGSNGGTLKTTSPLPMPAGSVPIPAAAPQQNNGLPNLSGYRASQLQTTGNTLMSARATILNAVTPARNPVLSNPTFNFTPANTNPLTVPDLAIAVATTAVPQIAAKPGASTATINPIQDAIKAPCTLPAIQAGAQRSVSTVSTPISGAFGSGSVQISRAPTNSVKITSCGAGL